MNEKQLKEFFTAIGTGNEDWNCSAPHGAGRLMSRRAGAQYPLYGGVPK